jgi:single-stranded DNA-binding protein
MDLISGRIQKALKVVVYGPEGIGKSTFASRFPRPIFCDTEGSTGSMDVIRTPRPTSWEMLMEQARYFRDHPGELGTFVVDTADWAERMCAQAVIDRAGLKGIEDFGYGKGYTYLSEEFGKLLDVLEEMVQKGVNVVVTAHAQIRKFEQPDEIGSYDRWEMKTGKKTAPLIKEWADMVLFANYKTYVVNIDNQGAAKGKNKAQGGARVMYTTHHTSWDAKNRFGLPEEMPFDYAGIAVVVEGSAPSPAEQRKPAPQKAKPAATKEPTPEPTPPKPTPAPEPTPEADAEWAGVPKPLADLMRANDVTPQEIRNAVAEKGYYPVGTPISKYDQDFIAGVLVGAWNQVHALIVKMRAEMPF